MTALKNAQMAQSPVVLLGGAAPTLLQGRGALQDIDQRPIAAPNVKFLKRIRRVRDLVPAVENAFAAARSGVQGPAFVECPVDLLYGEALVRQWYGDAAGKGTGIAGRLLRWYVERHLASMFGKSTPARPPQAHKVAAPAVAKSSVSAAAKALSRASRPACHRRQPDARGGKRSSPRRSRNRPSLACPSISPEWRGGCLAPLIRFSSGISAARP